MSSSNSPCAACKYFRRKCRQECIFAPYFPHDQPQKFENVHKVFGAGNVAKLLKVVNASQRGEAVRSLAYEAEIRIRDPVRGCVGLIYMLQQRLKQVETELASYIGPSSSSSSPLFSTTQPYSMHHHHPNVNNNNPYVMQQPMQQTGIINDYRTAADGGGQLIIHDTQHQQQQQQMLEAQQQMAASSSYDGSQQLQAQPEELMTTTVTAGDGGQVIVHDTQHQQQQQQMLEAQQQMAESSSYDWSQHPQAQSAEQMRFNHGFDTATVTAADYNQMSHVNVAGMSSSSPVVFGPLENFTYHQPVLQQQQQQQQQQPSSDTYHSHAQ